MHRGRNGDDHAHGTIRSRSTARDTWSDWFDGLTITCDAAGDTRLEGAVRDQTALYGLIATARDLGLTLVVIDRRSTAPESAPLVTRIVLDNPAV